MRTRKKSSAGNRSKNPKTSQGRAARSFEISPGSLLGKLFFIGGPCVIEDEKMALRIASALKQITAGLNMPFIFKASYDKANRTSVKSFRGPGLKKGLDILAKVKSQLNVPVLTDVHDAEEVKLAAKVADILQIPAFLCRQTGLITAAAKTGRMVNIKKGQFLSPGEIGSAVKKAEAAGNGNIILTERGFSFGYNNLVVDMRSIAQMKETGYPVVIDATHSVQRPGGAGDRSGGDRKYAEAIARAAVAAGADGVFMEVHHDVKKALSDRETQMPLERVEPILRKLKELYEVVRS